MSKIVPAAQDIASSDEYAALEFLIRDSNSQSWTPSKTGRKMIKHFGHLLNVAKRSQQGECNICDKALADVEDVGQHRGYVVHRSCAKWPRKINKLVIKSLKAYDSSKYPS